MLAHRLASGFPHDRFYDIRQASETVVLSDVYIIDGYRNCGLGSKLVKEAIEQKLKKDPTIKKVFLTILDIDLKDFYENLGLKSLTDDDYSMIYGLVNMARICYTKYTKNVYDIEPSS